MWRAKESSEFQTLTQEMGRRNHKRIPFWPADHMWSIALGETFKVDKFKGRKNQKESTHKIGNCFGKRKGG